MAFKEWWSGRSIATKTFCILSTIGAIVGIAIYLTKDNSDDEKISKKEYGGDGDKSNDKFEKQPKIEKDIELPNKGENCGDIITTFDKDFDYIKVNGIWHIKSKDNPISSYAKGLHKEWSSLENNAVVIDRLNRRYQEN